jgi:cyclopropane-fatty-acyl-phospholipid synthase
MFHRLVSNRFFRALENIKYGSLKVRDPDGNIRVFDGVSTGPVANLEIHDWSVVTMLAVQGEVGLAQAYRESRWDSDDLEALILFGLKNDHALGAYISGNSLGRLFGRLLYLTRQNTPRGSRKNIHAHYDLGNDFYKLWLDETMSYSSALFDQPASQTEALPQAQHRKYDRLIDLLGDRADRTLEIGCGWGGFASRAIERGTSHVRGVTLSTEQQAYAREHLDPNRAEIELTDYRALNGQYDAIVSIEMFEAVGERYWDTYFTQLRKLLTRDGRAVIQSILIDDKHFESYRKGTDVIRTHIFPGGMLPSHERFTHYALKNGLEVSDSYRFGLDYAETLRRWLKAFDEKRSEIITLGFDESFIRLWRFYLASCAASFQDGRINVAQYQLHHAA